MAVTPLLTLARSTAFLSPACGSVPATYLSLCLGSWLIVYMKMDLVMRVLANDGRLRARRNEHAKDAQMVVDPVQAGSTSVPEDGPEREREVLQRMNRASYRRGILSRTNYRGSRKLLGLSGVRQQ
jgi:hypothetical protein